MSRKEEDKEKEKRHFQSSPRRSRGDVNYSEDDNNLSREEGMKALDGDVDDVFEGEDNGQCDGQSYGEDEEEFKPEKIVDHREKADGSLEFMVKWEGYPKEDNTWEAKESLKEVTGGKAAIKAYEKAHGLGKYAKDNKDHKEDDEQPPRKTRSSDASTSGSVDGSKKVEDYLGRKISPSVSAKSSGSDEEKSPPTTSHASQENQESIDRSVAILNEINEHKDNKKPFGYQLGWISTKVEETYHITEEKYFLIRYRDPEGKEEDKVEWTPPRKAFAFCVDALTSYYQDVLIKIEERERRLGIVHVPVVKGEVKSEESSDEENSPRAKAKNERKQITYPNL